MSRAQLTQQHFTSPTSVNTLTLRLRRDTIPLKCSAGETKKKKESQLHGQAPHSQRPGAQPTHLEMMEKIKTNIDLSFGALPTYNLVSSPNVERKTRSLTVDEVKSSRERTPEYCTTSNSGRCCGRDLCRKKYKKIKQRSEGGHYRPFW